MPLRDLPGYYPEILDGGLGVLPPSTAGLFGVVGESQKGTTSIKFAVDPDDVTEEYGLGSLNERAYDAFTNRAVQVGIRRCTPTIDGSVSSVDHKKIGNPTTAGGEAEVAADKNTGVDHPYNNRKFIIRINAGGKLSEARYQLSANNGITFGPEQKFVKTGETGDTPPRPISNIDMGNGTYIQFTEAAEPDQSLSFVAGEEYRWSTTAAKATSNEILDAVEDLIEWTDPNGGQGFEYIYIATFPTIDTTDEDSVKSTITGFLADLASKAQSLWTQDSRPIWIMVDMPSIEETRPDDQDEWNFDEWM